MYTSQIMVYHLLPGSGQRKPDILAGAVHEMKGKGDFREMLCLFPSRTHLRHWHRKVFHPVAGDCYIPPHMLTLGDFAIKTAQDTGAEVLDTALRPSIISTLTGQGPAYSTLASKFTQEMKQHFPGASPEDIRTRLLESFDKCDMAPEVSAHALRAMDAFDAYESAIRDKGYIDREDAYSLAAENIAANNPFNYTSVIIEGFYELTPAELLLVRHILKACGHAYIFVPVSGRGELDYCFTNHLCKEMGLVAETIPPSMPPPEPWLNPARSRDAEIEAIARHIKQRHVSGANRDLEDTLIVFPFPKAYNSTLVRILGRYGIPVNRSSITPPSCRQGAWGDMLSMIRAVAEGYPRLEFSRFLTSPHFRNIPPEVRNKAPEAALNSGTIKGRGAWRRALGTDAAEGVFRTLDPLEKLKSSSTYEKFIALVRDLMEAFAFHPEDASPSEAAGILERMRPCGLITGREVNLPEFAETLESLLSSMERGKEGPGVEAAGIFDVRGLEPGVLYMAGLKDGDIPSRPDMDLLLPDAVRKRLGLVDMDRYMDLQEKIFTRLRMSARELYLSYPSMEEDKLYLPSAFLPETKESPYQVAGHYSHEEAMTAWGGDSLSPRLKEITLPGSYGTDRALRVTEIDSYRRCPRRFAIERLMGMDPTGISEYEMEPAELGSIAHKVMENLITGHPGSLADFRHMARKAIDAALKERLSSMPAIHEIESALSKEGFMVRQKEEAIEGQPLPEVNLKGKVDRIDMDSGGRAAVIDYKTGSAAISGQALEARGEGLQLFLYAAMLRESGMETSRVGIYSLKDMGIKWVPGKRDIADGKDMEHFIQIALSHLKTTVRDMRKGLFHARPISASICNSCNEVPFCPYFQSVPHAGGANA
jgi:RecB family exonuclease